MRGKAAEELAQGEWGMAETKRYVGRRAEDGSLKVDVELVRNGQVVASYPLPHPVVHSPSGFECGYGGSGPADLALAILVDFFGEGDRIPRSVYGRYDPSPEAQDAIGSTRAWALHQDFKSDIVACLPRNAPWVIRDTDVQAWLNYRRSVEKHARAH